MSRVAFGFRVKSGRAIGVALTGSAQQPATLARADVLLSDPKVPETKQPYHDGFYHQQDDPKEIARRVRIIERCAKQSVAAVLEAIGGARSGATLRGATPRAALVVGSVVDPATVGNPHIRAHAAEGRLFRTVLADALAAHGIACDVIVEKQLTSRAAADIGRSAVQISRVVAAFGESIGRPWRADEKAAATAAWVALC